MQEIVTVTYSKEKDLMVLQAYSLDRYICEPCVHWVLIEDNAMSPLDWYHILSPHYTRHTLKLITNLLDTYQDLAQRWGWFRQQFLKMEIANLISNDTYLILDAKNVFIKPYSIANILPAEGTFNIQDKRDDNGVYAPSNNLAWHQFIRGICELTGWQKTLPLYAPITPFRVNTQVMKQLLTPAIRNYIIHSLSTNGTFSEFVLYSLFNLNCRDLTPQPTSDVGQGSIWYPMQYFHRKLTIDILKEEYFDFCNGGNMIMFTTHLRAWNDWETANIVYRFLLGLGFEKSILTPCVLISQQDNS